MSQYHYMLVHEGKNTEVFMGWDRPLQGFFLVIDQGGDEPLPQDRAFPPRRHDRMARHRQRRDFLQEAGAMNSLALKRQLTQGR